MSFDWFTKSYELMFDRPDHRTYSGTIYFIGDGEGRVKIGFTAGPTQKRLKALQTGCPCELHVLYEMSANPENEKALHNSFADQCIRGEWFTLDGRLADHLDHGRKWAAETYEACGIPHQQWPEWLVKVTA